MCTMRFILYRKWEYAHLHCSELGKCGISSRAFASTRFCNHAVLSHFLSDQNFVFHIYLSFTRIYNCFYIKLLVFYDFILMLMSVYLCKKAGYVEACPKISLEIFSLAQITRSKRAPERIALMVPKCPKKLRKMSSSKRRDLMVFQKI